MPSGWDEWYGIVKGHYREFELNETGKVVAYPKGRRNYQTDVLARKAVDFIQRSAPEAPFFIHLSTFAPHQPLIPARRHRKRVKRLKAPRPASFNEADLSDKPNWLKNRPLLNDEQIAEIDERFRNRLRTLLAVDDLIKTLSDALEASGELANTFILYTSDNGFEQGQHRLFTGKNTPYEESIRVPLVVRGPGVPAGKTLAHLISNIDLAPTFAQLGGAEAPEFVDGLSLVPLLGSQPPATENWRNAILVQHWQVKGAGASIPHYQGVRTRKHLYIEYATGEVELYDLRTDPDQLNSLHGTADPSLVRELAALLDRLRDCAGDDCALNGR